MSTSIPALARAFDLSVSFLQSLDTRPIAPPASHAELRASFGGPLPQRGMPADDVVSALHAAAAGGILGSASGRFFGWPIGGTLNAALAADWLTSAWDQACVIHATGPAAAVCDEVCGEWIKDLLHLPADAAVALTTGTQLAHASCLASARHRLLGVRGWDDQVGGLQGAPPLRVLTTTERHASVERAVRLLGIGTGNMQTLPVNDAGVLEPLTLERALRDLGDVATILVLNAGDLNIGAFDPFEALIPLAHARGAWVHVDGAFGLFANAAPAYRHLLRGIERADSWATDGHKWLNVPYDCGYAIVRDAAALRAAMQVQASYRVFVDDARDPMDWTPDWSRRARGFATWAALRELGRDGVADLVSRCCRFATLLVEGLGGLPGCRVLHAPTLNQGLVRFLDPDPGASEGDHDRRTEAVIAAIVADGTTFFTPTTWRGGRAMRVSVCGWRTTTDDVQAAIAAVARVLATVD